MALVGVLLAVGGAGVAVSVVSRNRSSTPAETGSASARPERIAFVKAGSKVGLGVDNTDLFTVLPDGSGLRNLTNDTAAVGNWIAWSRVGDKVAYIRRDMVRDRNGRLAATASLFVMNADGSRPRPVLPCTRAEVCEYHDVAWSPDGSELALVEEYQQRVPGGFSPLSRLRVLRPSDGRLRTIPCPPGLPCTQGLADLAWSPDGSMIAFSGSRYGRSHGFEASPIFVVDADGADRRQLTDTGCSSRHGIQPCDFDVGPTWSPDGSTIAFLRAGGLRPEIVIMNADGTGTRTLTRCGEDGCDLYRPAWSPDGARIAVSEPSLRQIDLVGLDGTSTRISTSVPGDCVDGYSVAWSPDGTRLAFLGGEDQTNVSVVRTDGAGQYRLADDVECCVAWLRGANVSSTPRSAASPAGAPTRAPPPPLPGLIAYDDTLGNPDEGAAGEIVTVRSDGTGFSRLTRNREPDSQPAWSPDGTRIAYTSLAGARNANVFVMNADGSGRTRLTDFRYGADEPTWSPDGTQIAFASEGPEEHLPDTAPDIFVMHADGTHARRITEATSGDGQPAWSPDGRWILFVRDEGMFLVHPDGTDLHLLVDLPGAVSDPAWSPDGRWIAFAWFAPAGNDLYVMSTDGTGIRRLTDLPGECGWPAWSPDGSYIAFTEAFVDRTDLDVTATDGKHSWVVPLAQSGKSGASWQPVNS